MPRRVLVPVDGTPLAERALPTAALLVRAAAGEVILAHVHRTPPPVTEVTAAAAADEPVVLDRERRYLDELSARALSQLGVAATTRLVHGAVADALHAAAVDAGAELIVMETHDRGALGRLFAGSIAERVAHEPGMPVLVLRPGAAADEGARDPLALPAQSFRHLLVALDGSARAERVLGPAVQVARACGAAVTLFAVRDPMLAIAAVVESEPTGSAYLAGVARRLEDEGLTADVRVVTDRSAAHAIARAAEDLGADLVALTTHGGGRIGRLLQGSVADRVLHSVHVPVLLLNPGVGDDAPPTDDD